MSQTPKAIKPLGGTAYGSIPHLNGSRRGPADHGVNQGQHDICTRKARDKHDRIIVTEKLDGTNVAVAKIGGKIIPLIRAGYPAESSPREMHKLFHAWAMDREATFQGLLCEGERVCGEWIAQAHGTRYWVGCDGRRAGNTDPFIPFDLMLGNIRVPHDEYQCRIYPHFATASVIHVGSPIDIETAMRLAEDQNSHMAIDPIEGLVYRVERFGHVDFLAKFVRSDKVDGKYLPEKNDGREIWNWHPDATKIGGEA